MEVKRYKQTKEKLRRRRERLLHKVRLLASKGGAAGPVFDAALKVGSSRSSWWPHQPRGPRHCPLRLQVDLVDSDSDSEAESEEAAPEPAPEPAPAAESPPAAAAPETTPLADEAPAVALDADEVARKIKEQFRSSMARVMVQHLNPYRHSEAKAGRITCTADFKHLARKVGHVQPVPCFFYSCRQVVI